MQQKFLDLGCFWKDLDEPEVNQFLPYSVLEGSKKNLHLWNIKFTDFCSLIPLAQVIIHQFQSL